MMLDILHNRFFTAAGVYLTKSHRLGFNPIWNESMEFLITNPELAFIRFEVWDIDPIGRDFIGQRTIFLNAMASGIILNC